MKQSIILVILLVSAAAGLNVYHNLSRDIADFLNHKFLTKKEFKSQAEETDAFLKFLKGRKLGDQSQDDDTAKARETL